MAAIAASNVTITVLANQAGQNYTLEGKQKRARVRISISATAGLTYPSSGGIPLPTWNATVGGGDVSYGMIRNLSHVMFYDMPMKPSTGGHVWRYDSSNHALRGFWNTYPTALAGAAPNPTSFPELPTTWKPSFAHASGSSLDFYAEVVGW